MTDIQDAPQSSMAVKIWNELLTERIKVKNKVLLRKSYE